MDHSSTGECAETSVLSPSLSVHVQAADHCRAGHRCCVISRSSEAGSRVLRVVSTSPSAKAALEFAVDNDWVVVEGERDVSLTSAGLAVAKKGLS